MSKKLLPFHPILFRSLEELPDECLCSKKRVVLCDAASYQTGLETEKTKVYPISLKGANILLYRIAQELHLLKKHISWGDLKARQTSTFYRAF